MACSSTSKEKNFYHEMLVRNRVGLMESIELKGNMVLDDLFSRNIITRQQKELIESEPTNEMMVGKLLDSLEKRPVEDITQFIAVLRERHLQHIVERYLTPQEPALPFESDIESIQRKLAKDFLRVFTRLDLWTWQDRPRQGRLNDRYVPLTLRYEDQEKKSRKEFETYAEIFQQVGDDMRPVRIVIRGEPGAGKTTLVKKIVHDWSCLVENKSVEGMDMVAPSLQQYRLIVPLLLRSVERNGRLQDTLKDQFPVLKDHEIEKIMSMLETCPEHVLFLCDGYDEMSEGNGSDIEKMLRGEHLSDVCCVTTTRAAAFSRLGQDTRSIDLELELLGLNKTQSESFVQKSFVNDKEMADNLWEEILKSNIFCRLARNPILLQLMCYVWEEEGRLRRSESELYTSFVELLLGRYELKKGSVKERSKCDILGKHHSLLMSLGRLATSHSGEGGINYVFRQQDVYEIVGDDAEKLGFLHKTYPASPLKEPFWSFMHPSIQEFMIGYYIANTEDREMALVHLSTTFVRVGPEITGWSNVARRHSILQFLGALAPSLANEITSNAISNGQLDKAINGVRVLLGLQENYADIDMCRFPLPKSFLVDLNDKMCNPALILKLFQGVEACRKNLELLQIFCLDKTHEQGEYVSKIVPVYVKHLYIANVKIQRSLSLRISTLSRLVTLYLIDIKIEEAENNFLNSLSNLEELYVIRCSFMKRGLIQVADIFPGTLLRNNILKRLGMVACNFTETGIDTFCAALQRVASVLELIDVSANTIKTGNLIGVLISNCSHLKVLKCWACCIDISDIEGGVKTRHIALREMSCHLNKVTSGAHIARLLKKLPSLKHFNIQSCKVSAKHFAEFICELDGLKLPLEYLNFANNAIVSGTCTHFAKLISVFPSLKYLDVQACNVNHYTFKHLLKGWMNCPTALTCLNVADNHLTNETLDDLLSRGKNKQIGSSLKWFSIKGNTQVNCVESLANLYQTLPELTHVEIPGSELDSGKIKSFISKLEEICKTVGRQISFSSDGKHTSMEFKESPGVDKFVVAVGTGLHPPQMNPETTSPIEKMWFDDIRCLSVD